MTDYQKKQYIIRYKLDNYICQKCGKKATQQAHRIAKTKVNIKKYGKNIIDNNINIVSVCSLECNSSYNIGMNEKKCEILVDMIEKYKDKKILTKKINKEIK